MKRNRREFLQTTTGLSATALLGISAFGPSAFAAAKPTAACLTENHSLQIANLRRTMESPYIEVSLKEAMLRSSHCPDCGKQFGRYAAHAL